MPFLDAYNTAKTTITTARNSLIDAIILEPANNAEADRISASDAILVANTFRPDMRISNAGQRRFGYFGTPITNRTNALELEYQGTFESLMDPATNTMRNVPTISQFIREAAPADTPVTLIEDASSQLDAEALAGFITLFFAGTQGGITPDFTDFSGVFYSFNSIIYTLINTPVTFTPANSNPLYLLDGLLAQTLSIEGDAISLTRVLGGTTYSVRMFIRPRVESRFRGFPGINPGGGNEETVDGEASQLLYIHPQVAETFRIRFFDQAKEILAVPNAGDPTNFLDSEVWVAEIRGDNFGELRRAGIATVPRIA